MKIERKTLIIGHTALFMAAGCSWGVDSDTSTFDAGLEEVALDMAQVTPDGEAPFADLGTVETDDGLLADDLGVVVDAVVIAADMRMPRADMGPDEPDMDVGEQDMEVSVRDSGMADRCADLAGMACEVPEEGCCNDTEPVLVCRRINADGRLAWVALEPGEEFCECLEDNGVTWVICAAPGFVGITTAGNPRIRAPRLRELLALS